MNGTRLTLRLAIAAAALLLAALGLREVVNANRFQLFGDAVARVETSERVVALTFDDGPHPVHTAAVLDVLERYGAKATFFMMGRNVERYPDAARAVLQRGHEIGNHSYSHARLVLMSPARVREEIAHTDRLLRDIGVEGAIHFRAPHLSKFVVLPWVLDEMGKLSVLADVDAEEWRGRPASVMAADVLAQVRPGSIVMMHDAAGAETVRALDSILQALGGLGYRFETVSGLVGQ